jgi:tetratricopeptide (TPR) repeat protein
MTMLACAALRAVPANAATPAEFYASLLQRGIAAFNAGRYEDATRQLRLAAFGFVDVIPHYQTAQAYLALAHDRLGQTDRAREAARRVVAGERIQPTWSALAFPAEQRAAFDSLAARLLSPSELALLRQSPPGPARSAQVPPAVAAAPPPVRTPDPKPPQVTTEPPVVVGTNGDTPDHTPPPQPERSAVAPAPAPAPAVSRNVSEELAAADRALAAADLAHARAAYAEILATPDLSRDVLLRVAEGSYRARDFALALETFARIGDLRDAERPYRYYVAVALYETGQYRRAKEELAAALPFIEITPDVARYRSKIEGSIN